MEVVLLPHNLAAAVNDLFCHSDRKLMWLQMHMAMPTPTFAAFQHVMMQHQKQYEVVLSAFLWLQALLQDGSTNVSAVRHVLQLKVSSGKTLPFHLDGRVLLSDDVQLPRWWSLWASGDAGESAMQRAV